LRIGHIVAAPVLSRRRNRSGSLTSTSGVAETAFALIVQKPTLTQACRGSIVGNAESSGMCTPSTIRDVVVHGPAQGQWWCSCGLRQGSSRGRPENDKTRRRAVDGSMRVSRDDIRPPCFHRLGFVKSSLRAGGRRARPLSNLHGRASQVVVNYRSNEQQQQQQ